MPTQPVGALKCRNVTVDGRRTSIKLEQEFWRLLSRLSDESGLGQQEVLSRIKAARPTVPLTTSVRVAILLYQEAATTGLPRPEADVARGRFDEVVAAMAR